MGANSVVNLATIAKTTYIPNKTAPVIMGEIRVVMVEDMVGTMAVTMLEHNRVRFWTFYTLLGLYYS